MQKNTGIIDISPEMKKLTPTELEFVEEFVQNRGNATRALIAIFERKEKKYSYESLAVRGSGLLKKDNIAHAIAVRREELLAEFRKKTIDQLHDLENIKNRCMNPEPVMIWDADEKTMVQKTEKIKDEKGREKIVGVFQFDSRGAIMATAEQNKMLGLYPDKKPEIQLNIGEIIIKLPDATN